MEAACSASKKTLNLTSTGGDFVSPPPRSVVCRRAPTASHCCCNTSSYLRRRRRRRRLLFRVVLRGLARSHAPFVRFHHRRAGQVSSVLFSVFLDLSVILFHSLYNIACCCCFASFHDTKKTRERKRGGFSSNFTPPSVSRPSPVILLFPLSLSLFLLRFYIYTKREADIQYRCHMRDVK